MHTFIISLFIILIVLCLYLIFLQKKRIENSHLINNRFKDMFDLHDSIMIIVKPSTGQIIDANDSAQKFYGYDKKKFLTLNVSDINTLSEKELREKRAAAKDKIDNKFYFEHILSNGETKNVEVSSSPITIENEVYLLSIIKDISKEKEYQNQLIHEKNKLQAIIENLPDLLWIKDPSGKYLLCNKRFEKLYNEAQENIIGKTDYDFVDKATADFFRKNDLNALKSDKALSNFEKLTFQSDGHTEEIQATKIKIKDSKNETIGVLGIGRNISDILNYQNELEKQKIKYKKLMDQSSNAIFIIDTNGFIIESNNQFRYILGYNEVKELHVSNFENTHTKQDISDKIRHTTYSPINFDSIYRKRNGDLIDVSVSIVRITLDAKDYIYCTFTDISTQKRLQKDLDAHSKMINDILNSQPNMVLLTNGMEPIFVNKTLLDFYNCKSLKSFIKKYRCVCFTFEKDDKYFHLDKIKDEENWLEEINNLPLEQRVVSIKSPANKDTGLFKIVAKQHHEDLYIVNLIDITKTMHKQAILEEKVIRDKLTNAYNREYFELYINTILNEHRLNDLYTSITMIDIDFFKDVNDIHGHDKGDYVLKELVKLLTTHSRISEDSIVRWGGEEFILIMSTKNKKTLEKTLEIYRKLIEDKSFQNMYITCSFGSTIHIPSQKITSTIKRADIALYEAKRKGRNKVVIM